MDVLKKYIRQLFASDFMRMNAAFFAGSLFVAFLNYLYYPVVGRTLPKEAFGEVQVLVSFFMTFVVFLTVLSFVAVNIVVNEKKVEKAQEILQELERFALLIGIVLLVAMTFSANILQDMLKFDSPLPFIVVGLIVLVSIPVSFRNAYIRGKKDFIGASIGNAIGAGSKLLFSLLFVLARLYSRKFLNRLA
jgi:O-antigen/teichoic acid export membrane protein